MFDLFYTDGSCETCRQRHESVGDLLEHLAEVAWGADNLDPVRKWAETAQLGDLFECTGQIMIYKVSGMRTGD